MAIDLAPRSSYLVDCTAAIAFWDFAVFYALVMLVVMRFCVRLPSGGLADRPVPATAR